MRDVNIFSSTPASLWYLKRSFSSHHHNTIISFNTSSRLWQVQLAILTSFWWEHHRGRTPGCEVGYLVLFWSLSTPQTVCRLGLLWWMRSNVLCTLERIAPAWCFRFTLCYQHGVTRPTKTQNCNTKKSTVIFYKFRTLWFLFYLVSPNLGHE